MRISFLIAAAFSLLFVNNSSFATDLECNLEEQLVCVAKASNCMSSDGPNACAMITLGMGIFSSNLSNNKGLGRRSGIAGKIENHPEVKKLLEEAQQAIAQHAEDFKRFLADPENTKVPYLEDRILPIKQKIKTILGPGPLTDLVLDLVRTSAQLEVTIKTRLEVARHKNSGLASAEEYQKGIARLKSRESLVREELNRLEKNLVRLTRATHSSAVGKAAKTVGAVGIVGALADIGNAFAGPAEISKCRPELSWDEVQILTEAIEFRQGQGGDCKNPEINMTGALLISKKLAEGKLAATSGLCKVVRDACSRAEKWVDPETVGDIKKMKCEDPLSYQIEVGGTPVDLKYSKKDESTYVLTSSLIHGVTTDQARIAVQVNYSRAAAPPGEEGEIQPREYFWTKPAVNNPTWISMQSAVKTDAESLVREYRERCARAKPLVETDLKNMARAESQRCEAGRILFAAQQSITLAQLECAAKSQGNHRSNGQLIQSSESAH